MIDELKQLNDRFYKLFDELQEARPAIGDAYPVFLANLIEQYKKEYERKAKECSIEEERKDYRLQAEYDRIVPTYRRKWFRWRPNYAATLLDREADEKAAEFFAECEAEFAERDSEGLEAEEEPAQAESAEDAQEASAGAEIGAETGEEIDVEEESGESAEAKNDAENGATEAVDADGEDEGETEIDCEEEDDFGIDTEWDIA